jgi:hypothetical protein
VADSIKLNHDLLDEKNYLFLDGFGFLSQITGNRKVFKLGTTIDSEIQNMILLNPKRLDISKGLLNRQGLSDDSVKLNLNLIKNNFLILHAIILDVDEISQSFLADNVIPIRSFFADEFIDRIYQQAEIIG